MLLDHFVYSRVILESCINKQIKIVKHILFEDMTKHFDLYHFIDG